MKVPASLLTAIVFTLPVPATGQQVADTMFRPAQAPPAYAPNSGPLVMIDEGHNNFHTLTGRFAPFAALLARDGFRLAPLRGTITSANLDSADVLVIANPLASQNLERWALPTPSAYTRSEIAAIHAWVEGGGSLLLIADHMPFGGAAEPLAARFGVQFANGFVLDSTHTKGTIRFRRSEGSLETSPAITGAPGVPTIDSVTTFTGQGFRLERPGIPLLRIPAGWMQYLPEVAWEFTSETARHPADGLLQAALLTSETGRLAVFGEAAMFTAQLAGPARSPAGFNHPEAAQNAQFILNVLHWLARKEPR